MRKLILTLGCPSQRSCKKVSSFFTGPATKALLTSLELSGHIIFLKLQKFFFLSGQDLIPPLCGFPYPAICKIKKNQFLKQKSRSWLVPWSFLKHMKTVTSGAQQMKQKTHRFLNVCISSFVQISSSMQINVQTKKVSSYKNLIQTKTFFVLPAAAE